MSRKDKLGPQETRFDLRSFVGKPDKEEIIRQEILRISAAYAQEYLDDEDLEEICQDFCLKESIYIGDLCGNRCIRFKYVTKGVGGTDDPDAFREATKEDQSNMRPVVAIGSRLYKTDLTQRQSSKFADAYWLLCDALLDDGLDARGNANLRGGTFTFGTSPEEYAKVFTATLDDGVCFQIGDVYLTVGYDFSKASFDALEAPTALAVCDELKKIFRAIERHYEQYVNELVYGGDLKPVGSSRTLLDWIASPEVIPDEKERAKMEALIAERCGQGFKDAKIVELLKRNRNLVAYVEKAEALKAEAEATSQPDQGTDPTGNQPDTGNQSGSDQQSIPVTGNDSDTQAADNLIAQLPKMPYNFWLGKLCALVKDFDTDVLKDQPALMSVADVINVLLSEGMEVPEELIEMFDKSIAKLAKKGGDQS